MSDKVKRVFLALTVIVPFLVYCVYYYAGVFKNAPYKFTEFDSMSFQYGNGDSLLNKYNSKTGDYQYVDKHDSLIKTHLKLSRNELLYLHRKAADLGFWDFPANELSNDTVKFNGHKALRYVIEFKYQRKTKRVVFDTNFYGDPKLVDANERLIGEIRHVLAEAEDKLKKATR